MLAIWAVRAGVAGGFVDKAVTVHLILALEPLAALATGATLDVAEVGAIG